MGNEQSTENGSPSLEGLAGVLVDPSMILGETQHEIAMRTHLAANSTTHNTYSLTLTSPNPQAIPLLVSSSLEADSGLHIVDGTGLQGESQIREAETESLDILNPLALFPSNFIDGDEEPLPPTQALVQFEAPSGYINFLLIIILINDILIKSN